MKLLAQSIRMFLVLVVLTGLIYPLLVTGLAHVFFPFQAEGSQLVINGKVVGSALLAQKSVDPKYFWPRPSAGDYATVASGASNLGPGSDALKKAISDRLTQARATYGLANDATVPDDLLTTSGSGLDPDISPAGARLQITRVAGARGFSADQKQKLAALVEYYIQGPELGFLGDSRVNVLLLNQAVDALK
jgi:K+-transporting ATPase ATPase C chain